jgi:hypothetical protein
MNVALDMVNQLLANQAQAEMMADEARLHRRLRLSRPLASMP